MKQNTQLRKRKGGEALLEPRSVLEQSLLSPSPPTSASTFSFSENDEWAVASELLPIPPCLATPALADWETMMFNVEQDHTDNYDFDSCALFDPSSFLEEAKVATSFMQPQNNLQVFLPLPPPPLGENPVVLWSNLLLNQQQLQSQQNTTQFMSLPQLPIAHQEYLLNKRSRVDFFPNSVSMSSEQLVGRNVQQPQINAAPFKPSRPEYFAATGAASAQQQQQMGNAGSFLLARPGFNSLTGAASSKQQLSKEVAVDMLFKAAELVEGGNFAGARELLARLNHHSTSPAGNPVLRSVFYFMEALQFLTGNGPRRLPSKPVATPLDVVLKLSTFKLFPDVSPIAQFTSLTTMQALFEELGTAPRIHIVDFDFGVGTQWPAFMQELAARRRSATSAAPILKITAFVTPGYYSAFELGLIREHLCNLAAELKIPFEFSAISVNPFDPSSLLSFRAGANEALAVNLSVGATMHGPTTLVQFVKQLSPRIVIAVDKGCDRSDLSFSLHFFHAFQSCTFFLDSIEAAGTNQEAIVKIEKFLVQPWVEDVVFGRYRAGEKNMPWRTHFSSLGFVSMQLSNFAQEQAECLLKRVQVKGFHVDKRQASLSLYWQRSELVSVSAWKC